jgi:hypothetical protein
MPQVYLQLIIGLARTVGKNTSVHIKVNSDVFKLPTPSPGLFGCSNQGLFFRFSRMRRACGFKASRVAAEAGES